MCGIVGYIGREEATPILLNGLKRMEYRGYDSAGVAILDKSRIRTVKARGKIDALTAALKVHPLEGRVGIGHTRWATHGEPSKRNAHPHTAGSVSIVHNGIIENYRELKKTLAKHGHKFVSDTDSEVLAHLIDEEYKTDSNPTQAVIRALQQVEGTFGIAVMFRDQPNLLIAARRGSPLLLGVGPGEIYVASDAAALVGYAKMVAYLEDDEVAVCDQDRYEVFNLENRVCERVAQKLEMELAEIEKGGYDHFLIKEIMEQPHSVEELLRGHLVLEEGTSHLGGLIGKEDMLRDLERIVIIGCGTAYYAGLLGKYILEQMVKIPVDVEMGSEFRYREPILNSRSLAIIISQSGETADTLASLHELKRRGIPTFGIVNVVGSSVAREVDGGLYLHAGPEISVASTKAFTSQVVGELLVGLKIARLRGMSQPEGQRIIKELQELPGQIQQALNSKVKIKHIAERLAKFDNALYLGRDRLYPVALEGSHKLKEISYVHAEAYAAGEMKHGANALIGPETLIVFLAPKNALQAKSLGNLQEVRARHGSLLIVSTEGDDLAIARGEEHITVPDVPALTQSIVTNIPLQLLAYYIAVERGTDVDQPRNLAKSVTVE
jgi:glucosamine--fructose-6-phosphate aminotransferase (isomerizing)